MSDEHVDDDTGDRQDRRYPSAPHAASHPSTPAGWLAGALARPVSLVRMVPKRRRTRPEDPSTPTGRVVACHVYRDGARDPQPIHHTDALRVARDHHRGGFAWLGLYEPSAADLSNIADVYSLHPLAVEDAVTAHQRPKLERYGETLFVVLKTACYVEHEELTATSEIVHTGEVMVFLGRDFIVTVRHGEHGGLQALRSRLEKQPEMLRLGPSAVLHAICDQIVDDYLVVTEKIEVDIDTIEGSVFRRSTRPDASKVYQLKREVLELKHAVTPLAAPVRALTEPGVGRIPPRIQEYFRDVADHLELVTERIARFDELLSSIIQATLTQVTIAQNEDMRRISAWVAIAAVPTAVAGIYGMNFDHMPELRQAWGYPAVLCLMATICFALYRSFKRNGWL
ncbi:magnesium and cobalt transport protein CorA [Frankia sp. Cas3]|uniref:magnesium and cobalt transport protein CorA n=1 Tax=Frankia sp. Cas3 TaxID=3073926 RepID=UPI002AD2A67C|nr:magnesium and cobalt transport protein CorA [Frankia sp. Cas3]